LTSLARACYKPEEFGVTRECVRQWHRRLLPDAPTGHERQRQCRQLRHRRRLSKDPLIIGCHRRLRVQLPDARVALVPSHDGYRSRSVRVNNCLVGLTPASWQQPAHAEAGFVLTYATWAVDYEYCELGDADFLFLPRDALHAVPRGSRGPRRCMSTAIPSVRSNPRRRGCPAGRRNE
jgi:hypothetical protein